MNQQNQNTAPITFTAEELTAQGYNPENHVALEKSPADLVTFSHQELTDQGYVNPADHPALDRSTIPETTPSTLLTAETEDTSEAPSDQAVADGLMLADAAIKETVETSAEDDKPEPRTPLKLVITKYGGVATPDEAKDLYERHRAGDTGGRI